MTFPFDSLVAESRELGLFAGVLIGFAFGFVLERAGFGRANKLAAQFYFYDMTVFKVMFGAIVTAMLGLVVLSGLGLVELAALSDMAASPTFLWPMLAGGFLLGVGFIISGYCPGTSFVAAASGKVDGLLTVLGVIGGTLVYSELQQVVQPFHVSGDFGHVYLYKLLGLPPAVLAMAVTAVAIAAFFGAEKVEQLLARRAAKAEPPSTPAADAAARRPRRLVFATFTMLSLVGVAVLAVPSPTQATTRREAVSLTPSALAHRLLDEPWSVRVLDLRPMAECAASRIPSSECVPLEQLDRLGLAYSAGKDLVLVSGQGELAEVPAAAAGYGGRVFSLAGGFAGWKSYALDAPPVPAADSGQAERDEFVFRSALNSALTGMAQAPPPPLPVAGATPSKKKGVGGGGCQ